MFKLESDRQKDKDIFQVEKEEQNGTASNKWNEVKVAQSMELSRPEYWSG